MRGIPENKINEWIEDVNGRGLDNTWWIEGELLEYIEELQEPWMTLDEFLKSGFRGRCWINFRNERVDFCKFVDGIFFNGDTGFSVRRDFIVKVMPIHKPEPPK